MLDSLVADQIIPAPGGVRAVLGPAVLAIDAPERDAAALLRQDKPVIWTILEIQGERDARPLLLGFSSPERRALYEALRGLSGIGRRSGIMLLDTGETIDILRAVAGGDNDFFSAVPGLGAKRVASVIEKLQSLHDGALPQPLGVPVREWVDAREALVQSTGCSDDEAEERLRGADGQSAEELLKSLGEA